YASLPSRREKTGRFWKIDLERVEIPESAMQSAAGDPVIEASQARGSIVCTLREAAENHRALFERAFGVAAGARTQKFAALATALTNTGSFVYVPADVAVDDPIVITYTATGAGLFPYTLVLLERGARATIIERVNSRTNETFVCGVAEVVTEEGAHAVYASEQTLPGDARVFFTRAAKPGRDATVEWSVAELGSALSVSSIDVAIQSTGADAQITALFFPNADQHVDMVSTVEHDVGESRSDTIVKSAATGSGQARYLGNIHIAAHAQGSAASLRDDALLLSKRSHIDSVPALEIAANDVKAFHGATVGALDEEQVFYMLSRGIERSAAEKMIALGFFEPAIARFPTEALRERLRSALEAKIG
ncbi:MAG: Fe-S cluster assembly protein SufD, partial [Candidatus Eremiobacteraeota bacterium]|nr:Fe-S cluster assembly protein SufD [Candidatus Eremiobacteraeota bacterium]